MNSKQSLILLATIGLQSQAPMDACTGITLKSGDGTVVTARTIEWAESVMNTMYVVVPRHQELQSLTPSGMDGMKFYNQVWIHRLVRGTKGIYGRRSK